MEEEDPTKRSLPDSAFMRLFLQHETVLRAYARSILPDWNCVDHALQEASVTMLEKLDQLKDEAGFLPWAKVIVRFKSLSTAAALRRNRPMLSQDVLELLAEEATSQNVGEVAGIKKALSICIAKLSKERQELLLAPYGGDGRVAQLAQESGKTANALYKLLGRLREKVATCVRTELELA